MSMTGKRPRRRGAWLYTPLGTGSFLVLAVAGLLIVGLAAFDALSYAYRRIGISAGWIAIYHGRRAAGQPHQHPGRQAPGQGQRGQHPDHGVRGDLPRPLAVRTGRTTIAVNVGGAIVPSAVAIYLICHDRLHLSVLIATLAVIAIVFAVARPVPSIRIVTPALVQAVSAALIAVWLGGHFIAQLPDRAGRWPASQQPRCSAAGRHRFGTGQSPRHCRLNRYTSTAVPGIRCARFPAPGKPQYQLTPSDVVAGSHRHGHGAS